MLLISLFYKVFVFSESEHIERLEGGVCPTPRGQ